MERTEAIKIIKTATVYTPEEMGALETLIPELKESEDEQVRKAMLQHFKNKTKEKWCNIPVKDIISWLEKQKDHFRDDTKMVEQKPADEQFSPLEGLDAIKAKYYDDGFKNGFDEGVESVKPAEWDEYTKTNLGRALQIIKDAKGKLQGYQTDDGLYECDKAIECLEHFLYRGLEIEKPSKWSKEDEKMIKSILFVLESYVSHSESVSSPSLITTYPTYYKEIDWLKSLRPSWKPSKEQMKALNALNLHGDLSYVGQQNQLISLYQDLKKLM